MRLTDVNQGYWCAYCSNQRPCKDARECIICLPKTFAGVAEKEKIACWSEDNVLKPWEVSYGSKVKFWFDCDKCENPFDMRLNNITGSQKQWCPTCKLNKAMNLLIE